MASKGTGLLLALGAGALLLFLGERKAAASPRENCITIAATETTDFLIRNQARGIITDKAIDDMIALSESIGSTRTAQSMRDNRKSLRKCRALLIEALKTDLALASGEQLVAQAQIAEQVGAPQKVIDCLHTLAEIKGVASA